MQNKAIIRITQLTFIVVFLVIVAGSVVRMTGSGMGCPDWPKCFGYYIPPTEAIQVAFQPHHFYKKGQQIIVEDNLYAAKADFNSSSQFNVENWTLHEKHDYAFFNAKHTWTEYINRLLGALSGLFMLVLLGYVCVGAFQQKIPVSIVFWTLFGTLLLGFQAWLGRTVVDSNLEVTKITAHMFGALALLAVLLVIIRSLEVKPVALSNEVKIAVYVGFVFLLFQIFLGTQTRQYVDEYVSNQNMNNLFSSTIFIMHRGFSWIYLGCVLWMVYLSKKVGQIPTSILFIVGFTALEILVGLTLQFFQIPKLAQPLHLLLACFLFSFYFWLCLAPKKRATINSQL